VPKKSFRWAAGEELLSSFESSPGKFRRFRSLCGSHLVAERVGHSHVMLRLGCLDTPVHAKVLGHIWRSDAAAWYEPKEAVPEFAEAYVAKD